MTQLYQVICISAGKRVEKRNFTDYNEALDYAFDVNSFEGYGVLLLKMNPETLKWERMSYIYPSNTN